MAETNLNSGGSRITTYFSNLVPSTKAALILAIPFTILDAVHYYTAGTALIISLPLMLLVYLFCGALAGIFVNDSNKDRSDFIKIGVVAGLKLWFLSTTINTLISVIIGASSLGMTIFLGIPYLCLCAPFFLISSGFLGGLGGFVDTFFRPRNPAALIETGDQVEQQNY